VVPYPSTLTTMPGTMPEMAGAIDLRGSIVPVLDLATLLGLPETGVRPPVVMVLRAQGKVVGVGVHEICGVFDMGHDHMTALAVEPGPAVSSRGLVRSGTKHGRSGVVLDAEALAALPGMMLAEDRMVSSRAKASAGTPTLTFRVGEHRFGLAATVIEATVPHRTVLAAPVDDPLWIARIDYNDARLPLLDTLHLLGLGRTPSRADMGCIILRLADGGRVAIHIDGVIDMIRTSPEDWCSTQGFALDRHGLVAGLLPSEAPTTTPPIMMLDARRICDHPELLALGHLGEDSAGLGTRLATASTQAEVADAHALQRQPFLIFTLGGSCHAVPLTQVTEILSTRTARIDMNGAHGVFCAVMAHRDKAIPVIDLATHIGIHDLHTSQNILIVSDGARSVGFLLDQLCAVERHTPRHVTVSDHARAPMRGTLAPTIRSKDGETCSVLDLAGMIADF
jgi:purine-binding chemotaxis protein CheW